MGFVFWVDEQFAEFAAKFANCSINVGIEPKA